MEGFFTKTQTQSKDRPDGRTYSCASCGLYQYKFHPRMPAFGNFKKGILNVGEAPGETEDKKGRQWQGKAGRTLQHAYRRLGIDLFEDCLNINSVNCRPTDDEGTNRPPAAYEIACCRKRVTRLIGKYKPKVIILHGGAAVQSLIGHRWKKKLDGISKWRGWTIPDRDFGTWICPVFHPSYVQRKDSEEIETVWKQDLKRAFSMVEVPFPDFPDEEKQIIIVEDKKEVLDVLRKLNMGVLKPDPQIMAFDIETTGLKPQDTKRHRIACTSFCDNPNRAYVVPELKWKSYKRALKELLENPDIGKVAANMKMEDTWENVINGITVKNWVWDTMQATHVLDNRKGITGLKFQVYVNFGVVEYDGEIEEYLKGDPKNANSVNRVFEADPKKLRLYCGLDALFEYKLALIQMEKMGVDPRELV